jgi:glycyl-tRNA synthetase alpha subunit
MMPTSPQSGAPQLDWDVAVERANATQCTYWITVKNLTSNPVTFEGRYAILS